jgi:peptidoglycan/LPS O-acetylase OafA/YrhL
MQTITPDTGSPQQKVARQSTERPQYIPELDGIRAVAVLFVIFSHISQNFPNFAVNNLGQQWLRVWINVCKFGWVGVDIFFVLSRRSLSRPPITRPQMFVYSSADEYGWPDATAFTCISLQTAANPNS